MLGVAPDANLAEVKRAYRALAKRHHPDSGGTGATARFLAIQEAYEAIVAGSGRPTRSTSPARGERRDAPADWYADAREAARGRARQGRGDTRRPGADEPGRRRGGSPAGRTGPRDGEGRAPRTATIGSTTYDDAVTGEPPWDGATWYGAASGTYWTVNPREYADPRKHGPEYLARAAAAASESAARDAAAGDVRRRGRAPGGSAAGGLAPDGSAAGGPARGETAAGGPAPGGLGGRAGRVVPGAVRPTWDPASFVGRLRRRLRPTQPEPRVR